MPLKQKKKGDKKDLGDWCDQYCYKYCSQCILTVMRIESVEKKAASEQRKYCARDRY
jgi:hypothetical protein